MCKYGIKKKKTRIAWRSESILSSIIVVSLKQCDPEWKHAAKFAVITDFVIAQENAIDYDIIDERPIGCPHGWNNSDIEMVYQNQLKSKFVYSLIRCTNYNTFTTGRHVSWRQSINEHIERIWTSLCVALCTLFLRVTCIKIRVLFPYCSGCCYIFFSILLARKISHLRYTTENNFTCVKNILREITTKVKLNDKIDKIEENGSCSVVQFNIKLKEFQETCLHEIIPQNLLDIRRLNIVNCHMEISEICIIK